MDQKEITRQKWQALVNACHESQLPVKEFCQQNNVCKKTFYGWRKQLSLKANKPQGFIRLKPVMIREPLSIHIETPNGYRLEVKQSSLNQVLEALRIL